MLYHQGLAGSNPRFVNKRLGLAMSPHSRKQAMLKRGLDLPVPTISDEYPVKVFG
jgi:hypothetical protein